MDTTAQTENRVGGISTRATNYATPEEIKRLLAELEAGWRQRGKMMRAMLAVWKAGNYPDDGDDGRDFYLDRLTLQHERQDIRQGQKALLRGDIPPCVFKNGRYVFWCGRVIDQHLWINDMPTLVAIRDRFEVVRQEEERRNPAPAPRRRVVLPMPCD